MNQPLKNQRVLTINLISQDLKHTIKHEHLTTIKLIKRDITPEYTIYLSPIRIATRPTIIFFLDNEKLKPKTN